jgi:hypothetical protein
MKASEGVIMGIRSSAMIIAYSELRQSLRQILLDNGVRTNPGFDDAEIVSKIKSVIGGAKLLYGAAYSELKETEAKQRLQRDYDAWNAKSGKAGG